MIRKLTVISFVLLAGSLLGWVDSAQAGCLREWEKCGECVDEAFRANFNLWGYFDAIVDGVDCQIDLYHCIALGSHHVYEC